MNKKEALLKARAMRLEGRDVKVAYQVLTHANQKGLQTTSTVYRIVENGKITA